MSKADLEEKKQRIAELHAQVPASLKQRPYNPIQNFLPRFLGRRRRPLARPRLLKMTDIMHGLDWQVHG